MKKLLLLFATLSILSAYPQSTIETTVRAGQVLLGGLSILKSSKGNPDKSNPLISSVCIKNKLPEKIIFSMEGHDTKGNEVTKELVVQNDGKECVFNIPKGVYAYVVTLTNKEVYKKGEYKFEEDVIITIKKDE